MIFTELELAGAFVVDIEKRQDDRGFFGRAWCAEEFEAHGLESAIRQINTSFSARQGTMRGLHYQVDPYQETKFIRCTQGRIFDVIVDLRPESPTFKQWVGTELSAENYRMVYVPENFAHGFLTLEDNSEVYYPTTEFYTPNAERGLRFNDPTFAIDWPIEVSVFSDKDISHDDFDPDNFNSPSGGQS